MHAYRSLKHLSCLSIRLETAFLVSVPASESHPRPHSHSYTRRQPELYKTWNIPAQLTKTPLIQPNFSPSFLSSMGTADSRSSEGVPMLPSLLSSTVSGTEMRPPYWKQKIHRCIVWGQKWRMFLPLALGEQENCLSWSRRRQVCVGSQSSLHSGLWRP